MKALTFNQQTDIATYFRSCIKHYGEGGYGSTLSADENGDLVYQFADGSKIKADDYDSELSEIYAEVAEQVKSE